MDVPRLYYVTFIITWASESMMNRGRLATLQKTLTPFKTEMEKRQTNKQTVKQVLLLAELMPILG